MPRSATPNLFCVFEVISASEGALRPAPRMGGGPALLQVVLPLRRDTWVRG
jgi:hypothetical protein